MSIRKSDPTIGEFVEIGSFDAGVVFQESNPVVQIVDGDEKNIWPFAGWTSAEEQ